jgi:Fur family peroxide stress response transcriptional regulator
MAPLLTKHRETVLTVVQSSKDHPTARQVFDRSLKRDPRLSMATVYNSLNFLTSGGYIRRMEAGEEGTRYDGILARHDHLICRQCGRVDDVDVLPVDKARMASFPNFQVEEISLRVTGLCVTCQKTQQKSQPKVPRTRRHAA